MKKYLLSLFAFTTLVGCSNETIDNSNKSENNTTTPQIYTAPLTIDLSSQDATRAFDADWNWEWSDADTIYVFQDAGERIITPMTYVGDGKFHAEVTYSTPEPANFYFVYGGKIRHSYQNGEYNTSYIVPYHGAIWTPVMGTTIPQTTVQEISDVMLYPASGAIEIRAWEADRTTPAKIKRATLKVIGQNIYLRWNASGEITMDLINENIPEDEMVSAYCKEGSSSLFIQMPTITEDDNMATEAVQVEITNANDEIFVVNIPFATINIGKRSVMNVVANGPNYAEISKPQEFYNQILELASSVDPTITNKMKFIANSDIDTRSAIKINGISNAYATISDDYTTLEIHTPKSEFYVKKGVDIGNMFLFGEALTSLDLGDNFNTENVTKMDSLFLGLQKMTHLYLGESFTTKNVTDMSAMFAACITLENWDFLSEFNTSNVTNMASMFMLSSINNIDLSNWNTSNVTNMNSMFAITTALENIDLSSFDTSNVTDMSRMFLLSGKLSSLDLRGFNTSKVTTMTQMFTACSNLGELNISSFDFSQAPNISEMFDDTPSTSGSITINLVAMGSEYFKNTGNKAKIYVSQKGYDYITSQDSHNLPIECAEFSIVEN